IYFCAFSTTGKGVLQSRIKAFAVPQRCRKKESSNCVDSEPRNPPYLATLWYAPPVCLFPDDPRHIEEHTENLNPCMSHLEQLENPFCFSLNA
ncbi:MAG: hypothetical protein KKA76_14840, partial [Proteobacteria bacterium]|nr:hypothetical protein [Pseudomonadota bacterium]